MEDLTMRFGKTTGLATLGDLVQCLLDSERLPDQYEDIRIIEAVEMAPHYFWDRFVAKALDGMAEELERGFREVDANDSECEHWNESTHEDGKVHCDDCGLTLT